jgi:hypothetical protein
VEVRLKVQVAREENHVGMTEGVMIEEVVAIEEAVQVEGIAEDN